MPSPCNTKKIPPLPSIPSPAKQLQHLSGNAIYNALFANDLIQYEFGALYAQIEREGRGSHTNDMGNMNSPLLVKDLVPFFLHHGLDLSHLKQYSLAFKCAEGDFGEIDPKKIPVECYFLRSLGGGLVSFV